MLAHDDLKLELKEALQAYSHSNQKVWKVSTEHRINPPVVVSSRRADVAIVAENPGSGRYAIEIKTGDWSVQVLLHQLRDYLIDGYTPIVVTPDNIDRKTLSAETASLKWMLEFLSASVVAPRHTDQIQFKLLNDRLAVSDPLRAFFTR